MEKEVTLQVQMDTNMKKQAESLYPPKKETGQRIGVANGEFLVPDDIDACNEEISTLFGEL